MRIVMISTGSRGDVQPYIALGKGLQAAGHAVRVYAPEDFRNLAQGLEYWTMRGNVQEIIERPEIRALIEKGNIIAIMRATSKEAQRVALDWAADGLDACRGVDLIIAGIGGLFVGLWLSEKLDIPLMQAHLQPFVPTAAFPSVMLPPATRRLGGLFNRVSHQLTYQIMWQGFRAADSAARQQVLNLPPLTALTGPFGGERLRALPILHGFSPSVIPKPADWGDNIHVTGFWFLDSEADWTPSAELAAFLENGSAPVYIGFGSMGNREPEKTTQLVVDALARTGQRAVLASGWEGMRVDNLPENVFAVSSIPHAWLFPRVAAVVHHGGVGTTAAGMRAGVPSVIIPFFGDQPFWGQCVLDLGVGPAPIPRKKLTAESLAHALEQTKDAVVRQRAATLGAQIQAEDGVARAADVIKDFERTHSF